MLFCASNPMSAQALDSLCQRLGHTEPALHWYALVDLAFDEGRPHSPLREPSALLYATSHWKALQTVSPVFYQLPTRDPAALSRALNLLNRYVHDRPMLSFVQSDLPLQALADSMRDVIEVETADGQPFVLRWADTRVSATLADVLTPEHWARLCRPLQSWLIVDRWGRDTALTMPKAERRANAQPGTSSRMRLTNDELAALLQRGEPDALIQVLGDQFSELLPQNNRVSLFEEVRHVCEFATHCGITQTPDRLALVIANRMEGGQLWRDTRLEAWLKQAAWPKGQFNDALGEFLETLPR